MRILISSLLITCLYSCNEESADKPSSSNTKNNVEVEVEDSAQAESSDTDTLLTISGANKHIDDYVNTQFHLSNGNVRISKDGKELHSGVYRWVADSLLIELKEYPYQLDFAVERRGEIDYQLTDNHGLILQLTFENPKL